MKEGSVIGERYVLAERLGSGAMATVWRALDQQLNREVALKILHPHLRHNSEIVERFRREALAVAKLNHPNIVAVYDTIRTDDADAIVMELVTGTTLRAHLDRAVRFDEATVRRIGTDLCAALACAHDHGIIHRDLKPANILVTDRNAIKLTDFGIAKAAEDQDVTLAGSLMGTAAYLAPEQIGSGPVDHRADLYALSSVLYEAACGSTPFRADSTTGTALARLHQDPVPLKGKDPSLSDAFCAAVMANLAVDPNRRYQSAHEFGLALQSAGSRTDSTMASGNGSSRSRPSPSTASVAAVTSSATRLAPSTVSSASAPKVLEVGDPKRSSRRTKPSARKRPRKSVVGRLVLTLLVFGPLVIIVALFAQSLHERTASPSAEAERRPTTIKLVSAEAFDPEGTGTAGENSDQAHLVIDGDPSTSWSTESYNVQTFATKSGVGLIIRLSGPTAVDSVAIQGSSGWKGLLLVSPTVPTTKPEPSAATAVIDMASDKVTIDAGGDKGRYLLIWITDLGPAPDRHKASIAEITVTGRPTTLVEPSSSVAPRSTETTGG